MTAAVVVATGLRLRLDDECERPAPTQNTQVMMRQMAPKLQPIAMPTTEVPGG